jgi:hypothetical protein
MRVTVRSGRSSHGWCCHIIGSDAPKNLRMRRTPKEMMQIRRPHLGTVYYAPDRQVGDATSLLGTRCTFGASKRGGDFRAQVLASKGQAVFDESERLRGPAKQLDDLQSGSPVGRRRGSPSNGQDAQRMECMGRYDRISFCTEVEQINEQSSSGRAR